MTADARYRELLKNPPFTQEKVSSLVVEEDGLVFIRGIAGVKVRAGGRAHIRLNNALLYELALEQLSPVELDLLK